MKIFKIIGIIVLIIILFFLGIFGWAKYQEAQYATTAVPYLKKVLPEITKWDPEFLKTILSSEALKNATNEDLVKLTNAYKKLGSLKSLDEPKFINIYKGAYTETGMLTIITYTIQGKFDNGDALITIQLRSTDESFNIWLLDINSKALL